MHQDGGRIGAGGEEAAMAERDLAVVPGQNVETEHGDGIDHHQGQLEDMIIADRERQRGGKRDQRQRADPAPGSGAETAVTCGGSVLRQYRGEAFAHRHTRRTIAVPNKPFGLNTSTRMISPSATVSFSWLAIK